MHVECTYTRNIHTYLLVNMHQKTKIALEIAAKIANVNRPVGHTSDFNGDFLFLAD
jgi:hypothetical protein